MQISRVTQKLRAQIQQFSWIISPQFSRPKARFIEQMLWGIAASRHIAQRDLTKKRLARQKACKH